MNTFLIERTGAGGEGEGGGRYDIMFSLSSPDLNRVTSLTCAVQRLPRAEGLGSDYGSRLEMAEALSCGLA